MTASAFNIASIVPTAQPGGVGGANAPATGGLAGFEALMSALFPPVDAAATVVGAPVATPAGQAATGQTAPVGAEALLAGAAEDSRTDPDATTAEDLTSEGQPTVGDTAAALAASLVAAQSATTQVQVTVAQGQAGQVEADTAAPAALMAGGQEKTKRAASVQPQAAPIQQGEDAPQAEDAAEPALAEAVTPDLIAPQPQAAPAKPARNTAQANATATAPTANTIAPTDAAKPAAALDLPAEAIAAAAADTAAEPAPQAQNPAQAEAQAATVAASLTPAPATPAPAARTAKTERAKAAEIVPTDVSEEAKPLEAAAKPAVAKSAQNVAKVASATVEPTDAKAEEVKQAPESPDAMPIAETRAAEQSATPAAATAGQVVRGSPETVANMAAQIIKKLEGQATRFDIELNPHGLGKVDVRIEIGAQGRLTAGMTFDNPQAAADVKARAAELQQALERAGFDLSGGLNFDVASDRGQQQQQQNQAWQDQAELGRAFQGRAFRAALETADAADTPNQGALRLRRGVSAGLDVRI